jgi:hypothetical protein
MRSGIEYSAAPRVIVRYRLTCLGMPRACGSYWSAVSDTSAFRRSVG